MTRFQKTVFIIPLLVVAIFCGSSAHATPKYLFKVASLAPSGSVWDKHFSDFAQEVKEKTGGEVGFKVYPGGVMGNEQAVYRKMRVGQLQGGGFTMTGLGEVVPDFRIMGLPFLFNSYEEVDWVREKLLPTFKKAFKEKGLMLLAVSEVGFIYAMSTSPITSIEDMRKIKAWLPEGDEISPAYLDTVGVNSTVLSIPDVLSSLQTGLVDTVFNSFYGAIVLQWFTKANYVTDFPFALGYGAFLLNDKNFSSLPAEYQTLIASSAQKHFAVLLQDTRASNKEALDVLKKNHVQVVSLDSKSKEQLRTYRRESVKKIIGTAFSNEIYQETMKQLEAFRAQKK